MTPARSFEECVPGLFDIAYRVAFRSLWRSRDGGRHRPGDRRPWAGPVVQGRAVRRGVGRSQHRESRLGPTPPTQSTPARPPSSSEITADRVDVVEALRALPRRQREVVILRYMADLSEQQVADRLGCSIGTVKQHAHRALAALRASTNITIAEGT